MTRALLLLALLLARLPASAAPPTAPLAGRTAVLARGVNITNWFRFPARSDASAIGAYLGDAALADLRRAGFTFVRLPFDPKFAASASGRELLVGQLRRIERAGLGVVLVPASAEWRLEDRAEDRATLIETWRNLAPALRRLPPGRILPEVLNEPVFPAAPAAWARLQLDVVAAIRAALPDNTIVLDGADWSSLGGLDALAPVPDRNVVYSFHFYDPTELTSLAAYRHDLDRAALARLPFPESDPRSCERAGTGAEAAMRAFIGFVCSQHWDVEAIDARIAHAGAWAARNHATVLAAEFGASARLNAPARLAWIEAVRAACEHAGIGWALWGYDDVMGFDLPRPPGPRPALDRALLGALGLRQSYSGADFPNGPLSKDKKLPAS